MNIPSDVVALVREIFSDCNLRVTKKLSRIPNLHETSLDHSFIEHFTHHCRPVLTPSEWTIRFDCHFVGGGRHYARWEVADFGIMVVFRHRGRVLKSKVVLLQSKRLFPTENHEIETNPLDVDLGFNYLFLKEDRWRELSKARTFRFDRHSLYRALKVADKQYEAIEKYEKRHKIPVHYLLYNPLSIPWETSFPITTADEPTQSCADGCRVVPSKVLRDMIAKQRIERPPNYGEVKESLATPFDQGDAAGGWRLESYITEQLIACRDGLIDDTPRYEHLMHIFSQKTQPIHAAVVITFDMPGVPG